MKQSMSKNTVIRLCGVTAGLLGSVMVNVSAAFAVTQLAEAIETVEHHEDSAGLPQFDTTTFPSQIFWLLVMFVFLYIFFSKKTLPEISTTIENRREHVKNDLDISEKLRAEAERAQQDYEDGLASAREEASKTMLNTQQKILEKAEKSSADFREKLEKEVEALEQRLEAAKIEAMDDMNSIAAEVASEAAKKIVGITTNLKDAEIVVKSLNGNMNKKAA